MSAQPSESKLTGGRWVLVKGVQRWVPDTLTLVPKPTELIACLTCRATLTERCTTASGGRAVAPHDGRLVLFRCACGGVLKKQAHMCEECRVQARWKTWREYRKK